MVIDILKCHGSGNDFIIIDEMTGTCSFSEEERINLAKELCDRNKSIGSDGILYIQKSRQADARMRMFNTDGTEAEMCGNGLRCVARYVTEVLDKENVTIETMKANLEVAQVEDIFDGMPTYEVAIEPVSLSPSTLPLVTDHAEHRDQPIKSLHDNLMFTAVSVPNPHIVTIVNDVDPEQVNEVGKRANVLKDVFPNGVNVSFLKPLGKGKIFVRTFERGVGLTNACGTAMSASSLVSCLAGLNEFHEKILVLNPGGMVQCLVNKDNHGQYFIKLRGNATYEFEATVEVRLNGHGQSQLLEQTVFDDEASLYEQFAKTAGKIS